MHIPRVDFSENLAYVRRNTLFCPYVQLPLFTVDSCVWCRGGGHMRTALAALPCMLSPKI